MVWFKRLGPVFGPVSVAGRVLGLVALGFCRQVFLVVDGKSHSVATLFLACFHTGLQHFSVGFGSPSGPATVANPGFRVDATRWGQPAKLQTNTLPRRPFSLLGKTPLIL